MQIDVLPARLEHGLEAKHIDNLVQDSGRRQVAGQELRSLRCYSMT